MNLREGAYVQVSIKRKSRWANDVYRALQGLRGFITTIKPDTGISNILVTFPEEVQIKDQKTKTFSFLAEDLDEFTVREIVPQRETDTRRTSIMTWHSLLDLVDNHKWTITWDTSSKVDRGVIWTDSGEGMVGLFTMTNHGLQAHIDTRYITEWW